MWYRFEKGNPVGIPRIKYYQVAFYNTANCNQCFDEIFFNPNEIANVIPFVETIEDLDKDDRCKVFVCFDDGDKYELKMEKIN